VSEDERTEEQYLKILLARDMVTLRRDYERRQQWSLGKAPSSNVSHVAGFPSWEPANASTVAGSKKQFQENNPGGVIS